MSTFANIKASSVNKTAAPDDNSTSSAELHNSVRNMEWEPKQLQEPFLLEMLPSKENSECPSPKSHSDWDIPLQQPHWEQLYQELLALIREGSYSYYIYYIKGISCNYYTYG